MAFNMCTWHLKQRLPGLTPPDSDSRSETEGVIVARDMQHEGQTSGVQPISREPHAITQFLNQICASSSRNLLLCMQAGFQEQASAVVDQSFSSIVTTAAALHAGSTLRAGISS